jgi:cytochrome P450
MEDKVLVAVAVVALVAVLSKLKSLLVSKPKLKLPPGPWTLPLIGSIHHIVSNPLLYRAMRDLAHKHGPLMMLWLGEVPTLVVSSPEAAEAVTKTHDVSFADRHINSTLDILTFNGRDLVFGTYGDQWRQLRKLCVLELLSTARVQSFRRIREEEVARLLRSLAAPAAAGNTVDLSRMISGFINNAFVRESVGSRCKYQEEYLDALDTAIRVSAELSIANIFPSSRLLQSLDTAPRKAMASRDEMARILGQIIRETKEAMDRGDKTSNESMLPVLLSLQKGAGLRLELTDDVVMALMFVSHKSCSYHRIVSS